MEQFNHKTTYETIREIGDGMHANIYLAEKTITA